MICPGKIQKMDVRRTFINQNINMKNSSYIVKFVKVSDWDLIKDFVLEILNECRTL